MSGAQRAAPRVGVVDRLLVSYRRPRAVMAAILAERPGEAILFSFMLLAGLVSLIGAAAEIAALAPPGSESLGAADLADQRRRALFEKLIGAFLLAPLGVYLVAAMATPILRAFGGKGGYYESRAALSWGLLVTSPLSLLVSLLDAATIQLGESASLAAAATLSTLAWGALALALVYWASLIAEAHGFRSTGKVLGGALAGIGAILALLWAARLLLG